MDNILLSIIIPVYNVEKYIKRCLDSILCQETENYEVILVDDGSTDSSGIICDSYAKCRKNVVCIHKTNGGLSDARNEGLKHCKGKYVWFVDSDDYITEDALESLEKVLCKYSSDVVVCMSKTIDDYGKIQDECHYEIPSGLYSSHEYMEMLRKYPKSVLLCAQFHVVKKTFVDKHCFSFRKNILHEDELWTPQLLMNAFAVKFKGVSSACFGDASMFSFHATKVFNTIEGGAVCFKNDSWVQLLNDQKNFGIHGPESVCFVGGNAKMNEFQAAMGICNLRHLSDEIAKRKKVVERYRERLSGVEGIQLSAIQENVESNYAYFPVVFDGYKYTRNEVFAMLEEQGITARKYFYPLTNSFECYRNYPTAGTEKTPVAQHLALRVLTLPLYADLALEDVDRICDIILG